MVEASNAETATSTLTQRAKLEFLNAHGKDPSQNPKKAYEIGAKIAGFEQDEIRQLQDTEGYGSQELMSEAERDIESIIEGDSIKPNEAANNAYKQRLVSYLRDHKEDMKQEAIDAMIIYIDSLEEVVYRNEARALNQFQIEQMNKGIPAEDGATQQLNINPAGENNAQIQNQEEI